MNRKVSVIIPVIRPDKIPQLETWIRKRAGIPRGDIEILTMEDEKRIGAPKMVKALVQMARHKLIMFMGDDCEPQQNFLLAALNTMKKFNGNWGLVGLNCGRRMEDGSWRVSVDHNELAQHWLVHKELLKHLGGEFFHTGYFHCFCDVELTRRSRDLKRYKFCEKAKIVHHHPLILEDDSLWDDDYRKVYSGEIKDKDFRLYNSRAANGWKTRTLSSNKQIIVLVPIHGEGFHRFWTCVSALQFKSLTAGIDTILQKKSSADIAHCRNMLVSEGLRKFPDATHFLFLDADMTFPADLLIRLLSYEKDIVTINAYRKGHGHYPVVSVQNGEDDFFQSIHIRPSEGGCRRVTSAGTGAVLIHRKVFEAIKFPWFKSEYIDPVHEDAEESELIEGKMFVSEDNRFYVIATSLGFKMYCDFSIVIGHLGIKEYTWEDHEKHLIEVSKDVKRNEDNHEDADPGDSRDRDRQHDQPGVEGRL